VVYASTPHFCELLNGGSFKWLQLQTVPNIHKSLNMEALQRQTLLFIQEQDEISYQPPTKQRVARMPSINETKHLSFQQDEPRRGSVSSLQKNEPRRVSVSLLQLHEQRRASVSSENEESRWSSASVSSRISNISTASRTSSNGSMNVVGCFKLQCEWDGKVHKWIFPADRAMDIERVRKTVRRKFGLESFKVKYVDDDEDLITVCDQDDLNSAMRGRGVIIMI
jgi:hypothetical protein